MKATATCEWITTEPVVGLKCAASTLDEFVSFENIMAVFEFRANLILQKTAMELSSRLMGETKEHPFDAWNAVQPFFIQDLSFAYGELVLIRYAIERVQPINEGKTDIGANSDTKEVMNLLLRLDALYRI